MKEVIKQIKNNNEFRFKNIIITFLGFITLFFSIRVINSDGAEGLSIVSHSTLLFGYLALLISIISIGMSIYFILDKNNTRWINILRKVLTYALIVFLAIYLLEYIIFAVVNSIITVNSAIKIPSRDQFLDSTLYILRDYGVDFLRGIVKTLELSLLGTIIGLIFALFLVILRTLNIDRRDKEVVAFLKRIGIGFSKLYVTIFRGTPMIVQAMIIYYLLPSLLANWLNIDQTAVDKFFTVTFAAIVVVSLNTTAYLTEVLRGGIESVDKGQMEGARSLGLSYYQSMFKIVLPQAIKNSLPAICNEFIINIKDTSVLNVIGVAELFFVGKEAQFKYFRTYEPFIIVAIIYLFLTLTTSKILSYIEKRMNLESRPLPSSN
jgi:putative lysine transport system permease protein